MAFVRHYFAVVDYAYATGDTAPLAAISHPHCRPCAGIKQMIDTTLFGGGSYEVGLTQLSKLSVPGGEPAGAVSVLVTYSSPPAKELSSNGDEVRSFAAVVDRAHQVVLEPGPIAWLVRDSGNVA